jgi:hypothetical protein
MQSCSLADMVRPKKVRVYMNSYAGKRSARSVFAGVVNPLFLAAGVETTVVGNDSNGLVDKRDCVSSLVISLFIIEEAKVYILLCLDIESEEDISRDMKRADLSACDW